MFKNACSKSWSIAPRKSESEWPSGLCIDLLFIFCVCDYTKNTYSQLGCGAMFGVCKAGDLSWFGVLNKYTLLWGAASAQFHSHAIILCLRVNEAIINS